MTVNTKLKKLLSKVVLKEPHPNCFMNNLLDEDTLSHGKV
jgi:hypothetical protein